MLCFNRIKGWDCPQKSALLEVYDHQIERYLETFNIPDDYQEKILQTHKTLQAVCSNVERERDHLQARLERIKNYLPGEILRKRYTWPKKRKY